MFFSALIMSLHCWWQDCPQDKLQLLNYIFIQRICSTNTQAYKQQEKWKRNKNTYPTNN